MRGCGERVTDDEYATVPTKEGLTVDLDVALLYHVEKARVKEIYLSLGEKFVDILLAPELSSAVRGLTSEQDAKALYTSGRTEMQKKLKAELSTAFSARGIVLEDVLLKAVTLPRLLSHSIELKAQAEQESARMEFVLTKEQQEANRKSIEAKGIADFQRIVSDGISPALLQWKGIEATEKLAESRNSKIVFVGKRTRTYHVCVRACGVWCVVCGVWCVCVVSDAWVHACIRAPDSAMYDAGNSKESLPVMLSGEPGAGGAPGDAAPSSDKASKPFAPSPVPKPTERGS